jgi:hypothetical protein
MNREVKDRRNNDVLRVWYHAEAWLELIRLGALCGGRAVSFLCLQHFQKLAAVAKFSGIFNMC